jgi:hypothetical protein
LASTAHHEVQGYARHTERGDFVAPQWTPASHDVALSGGLALLNDQRAPLAVVLHENTGGAPDAVTAIRTEARPIDSSAPRCEIQVPARGASSHVPTAAILPLSPHQQANEVVGGAWAEVVGGAWAMAVVSDTSFGAL